MGSPETVDGDEMEESKGDQEDEQGSDPSQGLDPLKIHFRMQEDALKAKKVK